MIFLFSLLLFQNASAAGVPVSGMIAGLTGDVEWAATRAKPSQKPDVADEIHEGDSLQLGSKSSLVLLYFSGCRSETITGPTKIKVGRTQSEVPEKNAISSQQVKCEPPKAAPHAKAGSVPGALVLMGAPGKNLGKAQLEEESALKAVAENEPANSSAIVAYGIFLENRARFGEAAAQFEKMQEIHPESASLKMRIRSLLAAETLRKMEHWLYSPNRAELDLKGMGVDDDALAKELQTILKQRAEKFDHFQASLKEKKGAQEKKKFWQSEEAGRTAMREIFLKMKGIDPTHLERFIDRLFAETGKQAR